MDIIMAIIFFIMFLIILGILIYFIYDYVTYKEVVDQTVIKIKDTINTSNQIVKGYLDSNKKRIEQVDSSLSRTINEEVLRNDVDTQNITTLQNNMNNFDSNLKRFLQFTKNDVPIRDKLFEHQFDADANNTNYKINLLKRVNAATGITIRDDMQICKPGSTNADCMKFQVDNDSFSIAPDGQGNTIQYMQIGSSISSANSKPLASFGFKANERGVYFGGSNANDAKVYYKQAGSGSFNVADDNMFFWKDANNRYTVPDLKEGVSNIVNLIDKLNIQNSEEHHKMSVALDTINRGMYNMYSNIEVIASYSLTFAAGNNNLMFNIITLQDIYPVPGTPATTSIVFSLPLQSIGAKTTTINIAAQNIQLLSSQFVQSNDITVSKDTNYMYISIKVNNVIEKHSTISFMIVQTSENMLGIGGADQRQLSGVVYGRVNNNNYPSTYIPNQINANFRAFGQELVDNPYFYPKNTIIQNTKPTYQPMISGLKSPFNA